MTSLLIVALPGNEAMAQGIGRILGAEDGKVELRAFPDGETYFRFLSDLTGRTMVLVCTLDRPNEKILPLLFAAATARELGAKKMGLVSPYLAYMRQDRRFKPGEAVTSREVAGLLSNAFDWLVTVDPHLHRYRSLSEIYRIPTCAVQAAPLVSNWVKMQVPDPIIVGPDQESEQWTSAVANGASAPYMVLKKIRSGDREVRISIDKPQSLRGRTSVLVDDIVSSGRTMIEAVRLVVEWGAIKPICVAVHGLFADNSDKLIAHAGARVVTSNSIPHVTNEIDVGPLLAEAIRELASG